eukprot:8068172-Alexandrium_andersonii.AAC.1
MQQLCANQSDVCPQLRLYSMPGPTPAIIHMTSSDCVVYRSKVPDQLKKAIEAKGVDKVSGAGGRSAGDVAKKAFLKEWAGCRHLLT